MPELTFKPVSRKTNLVTQDAGNELLIYDLITNKAFCLNESISLVWQACDGNKNVAELANYLSKQVNSSINEDFVWFALEQLKKDNLLEDNGEIFVPFDGLSRREIIRKLGFASLVTLPIIASLVAPKSAHAASTCPSTPCRCPNATLTSCNGSTATVSGVSYSNCFTISGNNASCNCSGPFNANDSAGAGFKRSVAGCAFH